MNDELYNRPGLPALSYRVGDWASFRRRMLANLPKQSGNPGTRPLSKLNTRAGDDAVIALLDAWAVVADVLTFYQERIANEGYLITAAQERSVVELLRSIGYEFSPGVAASTFLAFNVDEASASLGTARVPKGTQIVSVPKGDEKPQTFETGEEIIARADWNALKPRLSKPQSITRETDTLYLQGIATQLQPGDRLLLLDAQKPSHSFLLTLKTVEVVVEASYTKVTWENGKLSNLSPSSSPPLPPSFFPLSKPEIFAFRQKAALFGYNAPKWADMPDDIKRSYGGNIKGGIFSSSDNGGNWTSFNDGLPTVDIPTLAFNNNSQKLFAGCEGRGVFRYEENQKKWIDVNTGLTNLNIQTLYVDENGYLFAGTSGGGIFSSKDDGESWSQLNLGTVGVKSTSSSTWESVNTSLPNTVVRAIISFTTRPRELGAGTISSNGTIVTGTNTTFRTQLNIGDTITVGSESRIVTNINSDTTLIINDAFSSSINSGTNFAISGNTYIFAGTDEGIYRSIDQGKNWYLKPTLRLVIRTLVTYKIGNNCYILAGSDDGIYGFVNQENIWSIRELQNQIVRTLVTYQTGGTRYIFAGTNNGVFSLSTDNGATWNPFINNAGLTDRDIQYLAVNASNGLIYAATKSGLFRTKYNGNYWEAINHQIPQTKIFSLIAYENTILVGTAFSGFTEDENKEWPNFEIQDKQKLNLNSLYPKILPESKIVLLTEDGTKSQAVQVKSVSTIDINSFGLSSKVTQIQTYTDINSVDFGLRNTIILAESAPINLVEEPLTVVAKQHNIFQDPILNNPLKNQIFLQKFVSSLKAEQTIIISGKSIRAKIKNIAGVFQWNIDKQVWERRNKGLTNTVIRVLAGYANTQSNKIIAATEEGVFISDDNGKSYSLLNGESLISKDIQALVVTADGNVFAGNKGDGIFRSNFADNPWVAVNQGLTNKNITALAVGKNNHLFAGTTNGGIFTSTDNGESWSLSNSGLSNADITCLAINHENSELLAGTTEGIFVTQDGNSWQKITTNTTNIDDIYITSIDINSKGDIFVGTADKGVYLREALQQEWKQINNGLTDVHIRSVKCWLIGNTEFIFVGTDNSGVFRSSDKGKSWSEVNNGLKNIDVRTILPFNNRIFIGCTGTLVSYDRLAYVDLKIGDILQVLSPPTESENPQSSIQNQKSKIKNQKFQLWKFRDRNGVEGILEISDLEVEDIELLPALTDDESVSEVAVIKTPPEDQISPILTLQSPLVNCYDPATTIIYANVVPATHGETIEEVLGSGDGTLANQTFVLKKPPLTYVTAQTAKGHKSTLEIYIDSVRWSEVNSLYPLNNLDQNYITRIDEDGTTRIVFGDGIKGARIPSGLENVFAIYRSGIGLDGNLTQNSLSQLKTRPLGIQGVNNPVPAMGAAPRESMNEARISAPLTVRTLDRIVSLQDFEDFTRSFAGIDKAKVAVLRDRGSQIVHLTVAGIGGAPVPSDSSLYNNLITAIDAARDSSQVVVQVDTFQALYFNIEAKILIDSRRLPEPILDAVEQAIREKFAFENREFGQPVTSSEAIAAIQSVAGVIAVDLDGLYLTGFSKTVEDSISAQIARWNLEQTQILPAQLLRLNPNGVNVVRSEE